MSSEQLFCPALSAGQFYLDKASSLSFRLPERIQKCRRVGLPAHQTARQGGVK
ncbi:MAG: hypothetical protein J5680_00895 [Neisseriaceae bacterium]|nr:hypothetical protein [Neisseriaceae bacterium]